MEEKRESERVTQTAGWEAVTSLCFTSAGLCSSVSSCMLLVFPHVTLVHFHPQVSVVHTTAILLFILIYMYPMSTHLRCWKTHFCIQGKGGLTPEFCLLWTPLPKWCSSPYYSACSLTLLANMGILCAMAGACKVLVWFMGRREPHAWTFIW